MHLLILCRQLADCVDTLAHELPVGHTISAVLRHRLRAYVPHEGGKDQASGLDKRKDYTEEQSKGGKY